MFLKVIRKKYDRGRLKLPRKHTYQIAVDLKDTEKKNEKVKSKKMFRVEKQS